MKTLSLKSNSKIFDKAISIYHLFNKRRLLKNQLAKESKLISKDSMDILHEFEKLIDEN